MNSTPLVFLGMFSALAASWWGLIVAPQLQLGDASTVVAKESGQHYPAKRSGLAQKGAEIYRSEGCNTCHSQLVRPDGFGFDIARGWGKRRTVAQDYLRDDPIMTGSIRVGPDLANLGYRMGAGDSNAQPEMVAYHLKHLYHPRTVMAGSIMPAYPYLFETRPRVGPPSPQALKLEGDLAPPAGFEVVPKPAALALVAYLLSLNSSVSLPEAPVVLPPTNQVTATDAATNPPSAAVTGGAVTNTISVPATNK